MGTKTRHATLTPAAPSARGHAAAPAAGPGRAPALLRLQRVYGNQAVQRLLAGGAPPAVQRVGGGAILQKGGAASKTVQNVTAGTGAVGTAVVVPLTIDYTDGTTDASQVNVSHERHLLESYTAKANDTKDQEQNTIAAVDQATFVAGFEDYGRQVADRLGAQGSLYTPNAPANNLMTTAGLRFHSDNKNYGAAMHCFPTNGGTAVDLTKTHFQHFKNVARLLSITDTDWAGASSSITKGKTSWTAVATEPWVAQLFTAGQLTQIATVIKDGPGLVKAERAKIAAAKKAAALPPK